MRTFSEDEARDVFARAAREQQAAHEATESGEGLTLDELQEIGRASGLDPAFVAAAAAGLNLRASARPEARTLWTMPTELVRSRTLAAPMSDETWEQTVEALRAEFGGPGLTSLIGRTREWVAPSRGGISTGRSVYVSVRPTEAGGAEVRIEQRGLEDNVKAVPALALTFGAIALAFVAIFGLGSFEPYVWLFPALAALQTLLVVAAGIPGVRAWTRTQRTRFEWALDRIELASRAQAPTSARLGAQARTEALDLGDDASHARLDLDSLGDAPAEARTPSRTRTR